jgi:SAM-dependent methyltransferase
MRGFINLSIIWKKMISRRITEAVETERTSKEYAGSYYETEQDMKGYFDFDTKVLKKHFRKKGKLFDATMGAGRHVLEFAKLGFEVEGNDYNKHMVEFVRKELKKRKLNARLYDYDITKLSKIRSNKYDYVVCMCSSLGCIPGSENRQKAMNELARVAKLGGLVIVHVHNSLSDKGRFDFPEVLRMLFFRERDLEFGDAYYSYGPLDKAFVHMYTAFEFSKSFRKAGLKVIEKIYLNKKQDGVYKGMFKILKSEGFIFVAKK